MKEQGDQEEEESASSVLRRLSSPIFGSAGFASDNDDKKDPHRRYDSDRSQDGDEEEREDEVKEGAAELIQR